VIERKNSKSWLMEHGKNHELKADLCFDSFVIEMIRYLDKKFYIWIDMNLFYD